MTEDNRILSQQIDRILQSIHHVMEGLDTGSVTTELVEKIIGLEVEFQFVEDRDRVQKRILETIEHQVKSIVHSERGED